MAHAYYFSHDANARNDLKIIKLRRKHGWQGYGLYWCLIEILRETKGYKLPIAALEDIAFDLNAKMPIIQSIIKDFDLFTVEGDFFCSNRLCSSMEQFDSYKERLSAGGKRGMAKRWGGNNGQNGMVL